MKKFMIAIVLLLVSSLFSMELVDADIQKNVEKVKITPFPTSEMLRQGNILTGKDSFVTFINMLHLIDGNKGIVDIFDDVEGEENELIRRSGYGFVKSIVPNEGVKLYPNTFDTFEYCDVGLDRSKKAVIGLFVYAALDNRRINLHVGEDSTISWGDTISFVHNHDNNTIDIVHNINRYEVRILKSLKTSKTPSTHLGLIEAAKK